MGDVDRYRKIAVFLCFFSVCSERCVEAKEWRWGPVMPEVDANIETFATMYDINKKSEFNPDNRLFAIPDLQWETQLRPQIRVTYDSLRLSVSPRFIYRLDVRAGSRRVEKSDKYLQDWTIQFVRENWSASYNRELLLWGPSLFASPSNPFFFSNNRTNPFIELPARDFLQGQYFYNDRLTFSFLANISLGRDNPTTPVFKPTFALKADYTANRYSASALVALRDGDFFGGAYGQYTVNDALLLYADFGVKSRTHALYPRRTNDNIGFTLRRRTDPNGLFFDGLIGGSYTFLNNTVFSLEYRHNTEGYSPRMERQFFHLGRQAVRSLTMANADVLPAVALLTRSLNVYGRTFSRDYLYAQYLMRDVVDNLTLNFLWQQNLNDGSAQPTFIVDYYLSDNWRIAGNFVFAIGGRNSEYRRLLDSVHFVGIKYFWD